MTDGDDAARESARGAGQSKPFGEKPKPVGFWFAMGHSTIVLVMAVLLVIGARAVGSLVDDDSPTRHALGFAGALASGLRRLVASGKL
jgi:high-affinity nickel permease